MIGEGDTVDLMRFQLGILCIIFGVAVVALGLVLSLVVVPMRLLGIV